jgi:putative membrane protein
MSAPLPLLAQSMFDGGHMGGGWGWLIIVGMVAMMGGMGWMMWSMMRGSGGHERLTEDPVEVLKSRYARGELTTEEFQERLRAIEDVGR